MTSGRAESTATEPEQADRVLLVDDNPTNLQVLVQSLTGQGLTLLVAKSGEEALEIAAKARPALILLDINMPGIGGFETCRRLKADAATAGAAVVFLSARNDAEAKVQGLELGAVDYIAKPFDLDEVLARVRTHLGNHRRHRELIESNRELAARVDTPGGELDEAGLGALIRAGESDRCELKSTLRWNLKAGRAGKEIENAWLKTIVAFLNTDGGVLLVGVDDDGAVLGIEADRFPDGDRYLLHANNLIRTTIGPDFAPFIDFGLKPLDGNQILVVECRPSPKPVFLRRDGEEDFFVRMGPGTRKLLASEILSYVQSREAAATAAPEPAPVTVEANREPVSGERILLVDDNTQNLGVLFHTLDGRGHELLIARSGEEALQKVRSAEPALVLLDIMMPPGIDGYETCRRLKGDPATRDQTVVFMSALNETAEKVRGLEVGAVDYITKPFQSDEVIARVDAHLTIHRLQRELARRNVELHDANKRMRDDLLAAARVQQAVLPQTLPDNEQARFAWTYQPCDELAGDALGIFAFDERYVGMYVLDVCGHGIPAALLSVAITHRLRVHDPDRSIISHSGGANGADAIVAPAEVARKLNLLFPMAQAEYRFFTLIYVVLDTYERRLRYVAAGQAGPLILRAAGTIETNESTGMPIGIRDEETYAERTIDLGPGDRVYLFSDGAFEALNAEKELYGLKRLQERLAEANGAPLADALELVAGDLASWTGKTTFDDDVSLVAAELVRPV